MPVFNAANYLSEAVESILNQTFGDFEFLVVDDGSSDGSLGILEHYAARDHRIRLISRPNTGLVVALNEMLALAKGEFCARMDADDISSLARFEEQLEFLRSHPDCLCVGSRTEIIGPSGEKIGDRVEVFESHQIDSQLMQGNAFALIHATCLFRTSALRGIGGYDEKLPIAEEIDLFLKLAEMGMLANLRSVLYKYRMSDSSATHSKMLESMRVTWQVINAARMRRGLDEVVMPSPQLEAGRHKQRWAWWALQAGNVGTARKFATLNLWEHPASINAWKAWLCALRGY